MVGYTIFDSPIGTLFAAFSERGICTLNFFREERLHLDRLKRRFRSEPVLDASLTRDIIRFVSNYCRGNFPICTFDIDLTGISSFDQKALLLTRNIPHGRVTTYRDIARKMGNPKAVRAVGGAMGRNPIIIIIPCHRVVRSDGSLGGYGGGLDLKKRLLELEGVRFRGELVDLQKFRDSAE
ncbi:MAG: methylated-DNA--[protein]-cysteine S-methyltransferase [Planctomycetota bacterium]|nr:methylated-DNA--[protein]-cysteine S-methyltransferase [Planctomycetota bacterium]